MPIATAATQNGNSDRKIYPALLKNLEISIGETWIGRQGKNSRRSENGTRSMTPEPPSVSMSSSGCVMAQQDHNTASAAAPRPATIQARAVENKIRKKGEWKKPRWPKKPPYGMPSARMAKVSRSGATAINPDDTGIAHRRSTRRMDVDSRAGSASAAPTMKWVIAEAIGTTIQELRLLLIFLLRALALAQTGHEVIG